MVHLFSYNYLVAGPIALQWLKKQKNYYSSSFVRLNQSPNFYSLLFYLPKVSKALNQWKKTKSRSWKGNQDSRHRWKWTVTFICMLIFTWLHSETKYHPLWSICLELLSQISWTKVNPKQQLSFLERVLNHVSRSKLLFIPTSLDEQLG